MRYSYLLLISIALMQCKPTTSDETRDTTSIDSTEYWQANDEPTENEVSDEVGYDALVISDNVPVWADTSRGEEYITMVDQGDIITVTREYSNLTKPWWEDSGLTDCDKRGYHFYDVTLIQDDRIIKGVTYGNSIYLAPLAYEVFRKITTPFSEPQMVSFNTNEYEFNVALSDGIGPSDSDGLTGCSDTFIPYFKNINTGKIMLIAVPDENVIAGTNDSNMNIRDGMLELVWSSDGGSCKIISITNSNCNNENSIVIELASNYNDGGKKYNLCITIRNETFSLNAIQEL